MKILLISDIHSGTNMNSPDYGGANYINIFGSLFKPLFQKIDLSNYNLIVNVGDAIAYIDHDQDLKAYKDFLDYFDSLKIPVFHVTGNHDAHWLTKEEKCKLTGQQNDHFSKDFADYHHIILNAEEKNDGFHLDEQQLLWLKKDLAETNLPVIVYFHYPCDEQDTNKNYYFKNNPGRMFVKQKERLRKIFEESAKVKLVISGHTHFFNQSMINGITYLTVPSFTENDGNGSPCGGYVELELLNKEIKIELKKV